jgi:hypothetical protein
MPKIKVRDELKSASAAEARRCEIERLLNEGKSETLVAVKMKATAREIKLAQQRIRASQKAAP